MWACSTSRNTGTRNTGTRNTGTRNTGTLEHPGTSRNTQKPGTAPKKPEHLQENQEHRPKNPEHPQENQEHSQENPERPPKNRNLKKQIARKYVTTRVSFSKLPPLIAHKIIWFRLHNLENI